MAPSLVALPRPASSAPDDRLTASSADAVIKSMRDEAAELRDRLSAAEDQLAELVTTRTQLVLSQAEVRSLHSRLSEAATKRTEEESRNLSVQAQEIASVATTATAAAAKVSRLERENAELRAEIDAFDASFFEELEDLKHGYAEASKKCKAFDEYVKLYPPVAGLPADFARHFVGSL